MISTNPQTSFEERFAESRLEMVTYLLQNGQRQHTAQLLAVDIKDCFPVQEISLRCSTLIFVFCKLEFFFVFFICTMFTTEIKERYCNGLVLLPPCGSNMRIQLVCFILIGQQ